MTQIYEVVGNFSGIYGSFMAETAEEAYERSGCWIRYLKPGESITIRRFTENELEEME